MKPFFRFLSAACVAACAVLFGQTASAEDMKFAVCDVQRAVAQTEDGLRAQATLKKLFDNRQQELNRKQQDMAKQREEIDKQSRVISREAYEKRVGDWQKQMMELQQTFVEYNKELEKKQKELTDPIFERVMGSIKRMATTEGYALIVDKATVAYVRGDLDLTDKIITLANGGAPPPKAAPAPAPGPAPVAAPAPTPKRP